MYAGVEHFNLDGIQEPDSGNKMYITDQELMREVKQRNNDAFGKIFNRHHTSLRNYLLRINVDSDKADDLVQETFLKIYNNPTSYNTNRNGFKGWLFTIAHHLLLSNIEKQQRQKTYTFSPDFLEYIIYKDKKFIDLEQEVIYDPFIRKAVDKLKDEYRLPLIYFYYHDKSYNEIAEILNITPQCVKTRLNRAKEKLRKNLEVLSS